MPDEHANVGPASVDTAELKDGAVTDIKVTGPIAGSKVSVFTGPGTQGTVPDPTAATGKVLDDSGTWVVASGGGAPDPHAFGGTSHSADTLANVNTKISDATLIDTADPRLSDARAPTAHATTHVSTGADPIAAATTAVRGTIELATQTEVNTATDPSRAITPDKIPKNNFTAAIGPAATDDSNAGYRVGSVWVDTALDNSYICLDATAAAAVWHKTDMIWKPPTVNISGWLTVGATYYVSGAGIELSFAPTSNDEARLNIVLRESQLPYDGSDLKLFLDWEADTTAPSGGDNVIWEVDYAFIKNDGTDDPGTAGTSNSDTIDISARTANRLYLDQLTTLTGVAGAAVLKMTLRRKSSGGGSDTYGSYADVHGLHLERV